MLNIILFIRRYFNLLVFLFLQGVSIYFIVSYSNYHRAAFSGTANRVTGAINRQYNRVEYYFKLRQTNDSLIHANEMLYNKLRNDFSLPDSANRAVIDTMRIDSINQYRKFTFISAKVVSNNFSSQSNYIVINGPNVKYFTKGMGIAGVNNTIVGIITEVDGNYATVMSLLNKDSRINGRLLRSTEAGTVSWNGEQPNILSLSNIPKSAKVVRGDTVISGISGKFPKGMLIGTVADIRQETSSNNFKITLRSAADFYNLEYVYGIRSEDDEQVKKMLDKAKASAD